ncbi:hypothetical protein ACTWPB_03790 [Nocardia sp. IBHARD005]
MERTLTGPRAVRERGSARRYRYEVCMTGQRQVDSDDRMELS